MRLLVALLVPACLSTSANEIPPAWRTVLQEISAASLRGHAAFLASDMLEGRGTPSHGADIAAEYIAAQFRRATLEPPFDGSYFQASPLRVRRRNEDGLELTIQSDGHSIKPARERFAVRSSRDVNISHAPVLATRFEKVSDLDKEGSRGAAVVFEMPKANGRTDCRVVVRELQELTAPALFVILDPSGAQSSCIVNPELADRDDPPATAVPVAALSDPEAVALLSEPRRVEAPVTVSLRARSDLEETLSLKNVAGILRGKDPELAGTAVVVSAHYDHVGMGLGSDRVYNGANDNASGTAAVIELAAALARLPERPRRSIVFLAFDGEERGLFGSRRYLEAPVFPLDKTVAVINLEHLGRTDSAEGTKLKTVSVTGFHYSSVGPILKEAGEGTGVVVQPQDDDGESYFTRSDNITFARKGVPAHTVAVSLTYPDYHQPGDHWDKLDYDNMAAVTRAIALAILRIADAVDVPAWNKDSPAADNYRKVRENQAPESGAPPG